VRFDEGADEAEDLAVPSLADGDIADGEAEMMHPGDGRDGSEGGRCFDDGAHADLLNGLM
jgi:hypothetical protein